MLTQIRDEAAKIAREAGALLLDYAADHRNTVETKDTNINLVTAADKASEALIVAAIQAVYPDHHIHGEEGGGYGPAVADAPFSWFIDPVDGTTSYAHGYPGFCVNISVAGPDGAPVTGVTYDPLLDEMFAVIKGQGATLNGQPIQVSKVDQLIKALLGSGFPYDRQTVANNNTRAWSVFATNTQGVRRNGSAALELAYVACGRLDGYWERGPQPWDYLAGMLMVCEAGGQVSHYDGGTDGLYTGNEILASNGLIHVDMVDVLQMVEASFRG